MFSEKLAGFRGAGQVRDAGSRASRQHNVPNSSPRALQAVVEMAASERAGSRAGGGASPATVDIVEGMPGERRAS